MVEVIGHGLYGIAKGVLPKMTTPTMREIMAAALDKGYKDVQKEVTKRNKRKKSNDPKL